jgi:predicted GIY-YIG superfamily endonuclease
MEKVKSHPGQLCVVYVHTARFMGREISKVGITNNLIKRLKEFNNGLRHRSRYARDLNGVEFNNAFSILVGSREKASHIEREVTKSLKSVRLSEFGREVFDIPGTEMELAIKEHVVRIC